MANSYLSRTPSSAGNRRTWTWSCWVKRSLISSGTQTLFRVGQNDQLRFNSSDQLDWYTNNASARLITTRLFRDSNAWYHIMAVMDTTQGTSSNRMKIYVNGVQETAFGTSNYPSQDFDTDVNNTTVTGIGYAPLTTNEYLDGYLSHVALVDGTALTPTSFGETDSTSGIWKFKSPSGVTWGTNGFHLKFENSGNLGLDSSGQTNNFTSGGNLRQALDTPSNVHATINSLDNYYFSGTFSNGNNTVVSNASKENYWTSTLGASTGKWYWEVKISSSGSGRDYVGIADKVSTTSAFSAFSGNSKMRSYYGYTGVSVVGSTGSTFGDTFGTGDIIGVAMDLDNHKLYFSKNGVFQNSQNPVTGTNGLAIDTSPESGSYYAQAANIHNTSSTFQANFGNGFFGTTAISSAGSNGNGSLFEYDVPSGFYALNTKNINTYG